MPNQTHFNYNPPKVQKLIKEGQNRIKTPFFGHFLPKNGFRKKKSNLNGIQVVLGHLFWELLACISTIKGRPLLSFSHHSLEHGYATKILSLLPLFSILLSQIFKVFGYCNVVTLLGFIIHLSLEDTFVGAPILWLEE